MATLREYILSQSTLPTGNTVRDHIQNPITEGGGGDPYPVYYRDIQIAANVQDISMEFKQSTVEAVESTIEAEVETRDITIERTETDVEVD